MEVGSLAEPELTDLVKRVSQGGLGICSCFLSHGITDVGFQTSF